jgi:hypothetical protein
MALIETTTEMIQLKETSTELDNQILITTFGIVNNHNEQEEDFEEEEEEETSTASIEAQTSAAIVVSTTPIPQSTVYIEEEKDRNLKFRQNAKLADNEDENEDETETDSNKIQNFKAINSIKTTEILRQTEENRLITQKPSFQIDQRSTSSSFTLSRSSPQLNVALYIVICLLCFSLIINIILLYVSKMKQNREKLIITHEICSKPLVNTPSQRSGINSTKTSNSDDLGDCNINLINTNGSATSGIDGEN